MVICKHCHWTLHLILFSALKVYFHFVMLQGLGDCLYADATYDKVDIYWAKLLSKACH